MTTKQHQEQAEHLVGVVIAKPALLWENDTIARITSAHMPTPALKSAWTAIYGCLSNGGLPDGEPGVSEILRHAPGATLDSDYLYSCLATGSIQREQNTAGNTAQAVIDHAARAALAVRLSQGAKDLNEGKPLTEVQERVIAAMAQDAGGEEITHNLSEDIEDAFTSESEIGLTTGIKWLDDRTGGILPDELWLLGGRYKGYKTRTARHMTISQLLQTEANISFFAIEGAYRPFALDLVALLATRYLTDDGYRQEATLSGRLFRRLGNSWTGYCSERQQQAVLKARQQLRTWADAGRIRVYTKERDHGRVNTIADMRRLLRHDVQRGCNIWYADYAQRFSENGSIFEAMQHVAMTSQDMIQEFKVPGVLLVQRNEAQNNATDNLSGSAGIKGGGDLAASADTYLTTASILNSIEKAQATNSPTVNMTLQLWFSRNAEPDKATLVANRTSGLILGEVYDHN